MKIDIHNVSVLLGSKIILDKISLSIHENEQWAIIGSSGAGKTTLAKALAKKLFFRGEIKINPKEKDSVPNIVLINQQHRFKNKSNVENFYYQQRFNSADTEDTITVEQDLNTSSENNQELAQWIEIFGIDSILFKPLIQLSNGENKRLQLTKAMLNKPDLLILDNPFIGLDTSGRNSLENALNIISNKGIKILLIASQTDLPTCITHVAMLENGIITNQGKKEIYNFAFDVNKSNIIDQSLLDQCYMPQDVSFDFLVNMIDVNIRYNNNQILSNINWQVKPGEKWCVSGPNGSGKSTLLSLITADNPQAYANEIYLFDRKKGSGESIWDIKKNIGYLSPELHLFFNQGETGFQTVASGLFDTIGLFKKPNAEQTELILKWMKLFSIDHLAEKWLHQLSLGEQRMILLTRAMVKSPPLLILDEPCQGLDRNQTEKIKGIINEVCLSKNTTLIYVSHYEIDKPSCINKKLQLEKGRILAN
jgi:molybdate transport system ATP-binding protein